MRLKTRVICATFAVASVAAMATAGYGLVEDRGQPTDSLKAVHDPSDRVKKDLADHAALYGNEYVRPKAMPIPPPVTDEPTRSAGVESDVHDGPFSSFSFAISDAFQGPVNEKWVVVFAGTSEPNSRALGGLRIYDGPLDVNDGTPDNFVGEFTLPGTTQLRILSEKAGTLMLVDTVTDKSYQFDLLARVFL